MSAKSILDARGRMLQQYINISPDFTDDKLSKDGVTYSESIQNGNIQLVASPGAAINLQTSGGGNVLINGSPIQPAGLASISSIQLANAKVECLNDGSIAMLAAGSQGAAFIVNPDGSISMSTGVSPANGVLLLDADDDIDIFSATGDITLNPGASTIIHKASEINFLSNGVITGISSINGYKYTGNEPSPDLVVSSLNARNTVSTQSVYTTVAFTSFVRASPLSPAGFGIVIDGQDGDVRIGTTGEIRFGNSNNHPDVKSYGNMFLTDYQLQVSSLVGVSSINNGKIIFPPTGGINITDNLNLTTVNGAAYPPPVPTNLSVDTLTANSVSATNITAYSAGYVSTPVILGLSSINGQQYPPPDAIISPNLTLSTLNLAGGANPALALNIGRNPAGTFSQPLGFSVAGHTNADEGVLTIIGGDVGRGAVGENCLNIEYYSTSLSVAAPIAVSKVYANSANISSLLNISSINGAVYPPIATIPTNLSVSTLTTNTLGYVSTAAINGLSSINGAVYPPIASAGNIPYSLTGTTAGAVIVNAPIGVGNPFTQNIFTVVSQITFNLPAVLGATESVYYDGYLLTDWQANFNSFWGVSYTTNTYAIPTDILGSTTLTTSALQFNNNNQIYLPLNIIIPPTNITSGGTVTFKIYCNPTSINHYLTVTPINTARIGLVID